MCSEYDMVVKSLFFKSSLYVVVCQWCGPGQRGTSEKKLLAGGPLNTPPMMDGSTEINDWTKAVHRPVGAGRRRAGGTAHPHIPEYMQQSN